MLVIGVAYTIYATPQPEVKIRLFNQRVYSDSSNIDIQVELTNTDILPITFKLADSRVHNIQLDVRSLTNDKISECDNCIKEFISSQPVYYSQIRLKPGEQFSFIIKLDDFVEIKESGKYFIKVWFFKEFRSNSVTPIGSNSIDVEIIPPEPTTETFVTSLPKKSLTLKAQPLYPDEVVKWTIESRIKCNQEKEHQAKQKYWDEYFLYLDLEELYLKSGDNRREYITLSEDARIKKVEEYKSWLKDGIKDKDLLLVPSSYQILKTSFTDNNAVVVVYQEFNNGSFIDRKQYSYFLRRDDSIWNIYDYAIINMMESPNP